jgi:hypothetical protein
MQSRVFKQRFQRTALAQALLMAFAGAHVATVLIRTLQQGVVEQDAFYFGLMVESGQLQQFDRLL